MLLAPAGERKYTFLAVTNIATMLVGIPRFEIAPIHPRLSILWAIVYPLHNCRHQGIETNYPAGAENAPFTFPDRWRFYSQIQ
jgi:hypothetical protein